MGRFGVKAISWSDWLDDGLDRISAASLPTMGLRLAVTAICSLFAALALGWRVALGWSLAIASAEVAVWFASRPQLRSTPTSPRARLVYFLAVAWMNLVWWSLVLGLWFADGSGFRVAAVCLMAAHLAHAQSFVARSPSLLLVVGGGPAVLLVVLTTAFFDHDGAEHFVTAAGAVLLIAYSAKAAITNRRQSEELERARNQAEAANQAKTAFLALMSHELRTPMTGVLGMARALKLGNLSPRQNEQVDLLLRSGEGLLALLNDFLDVSKIEAGRFELEVIPLSLTAKVDFIRDLWSDAAEAKGLRLICTPPADPTWVLGDPTRIRQIMMNLVSNAVKFTTSGEVRLEVVVEALEDGQARVTINVADTGIGIDPRQQHRLFETFSQADASVTRRFGGTGLGLAICRRLARMMDGDVFVQSRLGEGSTFTATLRLPTCSAAERDADARLTIDLTGLRILAVDDNATNRVVIQTLLEAFGCVVDTATDGRDALDRLRAKSFHAVLMDIHMPVLGGVEALAAIRAGEAGDGDIPVIALTADVLPATIEALLGKGFDAVQPKPISPEALAAALTVSIEARQRGRT